MAHSWRKRFLNRPLVEESPRFNFTAVQILDFTGEGSAVETKRVHVEETARSQLPELSEGTAVRWIHMKTLDMDYDLLMNFALTHQEFTKEERVSVYRLLKQFRGDQQRSSNHGKYFEPACLQQTQLSKGVESEHQPQFISLPYISLGQASSLVNSLLPLRRSIHPIFSLLQYHHRRESAASTASRDSEQACTKLSGSGPNPIVLVNNLWILILNRSTIITVAPTDGDQLWSRLKLINSCDVKAPETGKVNLWEALDEFASQLQQKLESAIADLENTLRYQRRIKSSLPASLIEMIEKRFSKSEEPLNGFLGFLYLLINTEWTIKLQYRFSTLDSFLSGNRARFEGRKNAEKCEISEEVELQSESLCLFFYENVETYIKKFTKLRGRAAIPLLFPSNKATLDTLWLDVKHQSQLFLWKLSAMDLNTEVMAATGLSEFAQVRDVPTDIEQLVALAVGSLVPEDSTEATSPTIGDIYSQYIAHLQLEAQKFPSKALIRNIYQVTEELEIIASIVKSQYRVVAQMVQVFQAWNRNTNTSDHKGNPPYLETLNKTLQKLQFSQADLEEYQNSCSRLANLAAQRLVDSRLEHIGKTVLTLTTVTMIFLPLLFISNLFGMNFVDIREMEANQWIFWVSALCVTFAVRSLALVMAFFGERLVRKIRRSSEGEENCGRRFAGVKES